MKLTRGLLAGGVALVLTLTGCADKSDSSGGTTGTKADAKPSTSLFGDVNALVEAASGQSKSKQSAQMTFDMAFGGQNMTGSGAYRMGDNPAMKMQMDSPTGSIEMVLVDRTLYMKMPAELAGKAGSDGKPWIKISADGTDPMSKAMAPLFDQMEETVDVTKSLEKIKEAGTITSSGEETLDGEKVTRYAITVDVAKLAEIQQDPTLKQAAEAQIKAGITKIDQELWLNSDNLPVKVTTQIPMPGAGNGTATILFKDWGQPVDISAPPADQVTTPPGS
jgi:hypothetical protein